MLALARAGAVRPPLAQFLEQRLWLSMGAEADASWMVDASGQEATWTGQTAVLRDHARFGVPRAHGGRIGPRQLIPVACLRAAIPAADDDLHLRRVWERTGPGYGYQTWVFDDAHPMFAVLGTFGHAIHVDPGAAWSWCGQPCACSPPTPSWKRWRRGAAWWRRWVRAEDCRPGHRGMGTSCPGR